MKLTLCSSAFFAGDTYKVKTQLETLGHQVLVYPRRVGFKGEELPAEVYYQRRRQENEGEDLETRRGLMRDHIRKIEQSEAILVLNYDKDGKEGYIGGNTFLEISIAYYLGKKIFMWKMPHKGLPYYEELVAIAPEILNESLEIFGKGK